MFSNSDLPEQKELKRLKKRDRRRDGMLIAVALQITSLAIFYYLGRTSRKKDIDNK